MEKYGHDVSFVKTNARKPRISTLVQISHIICIIPVVYFCAKENPELLFTARSIVRIELSVAALIILCCCFKFKLLDILKNLIPPFTSSVIMMASAYLMLKLSNNFIWQFISVFICIIIYFATLLLLFPKTRRELFSIPIVSKVLSKVIKKDR